MSLDDMLESPAYRVAAMLQERKAEGFDQAAERLRARKAAIGGPVQAAD